MSFLDSENGSEEASNGNGDSENGDGDPNIVSYSVASTCIANLTYHRDTMDLFITFMDGRKYVIERFSEIELGRWVTAESIGGYFNAFVRGNY